MESAIKYNTASAAVATVVAKKSRLVLYSVHQNCSTTVSGPIINTLLNSTGLLNLYPHSASVLLYSRHNLVVVRKEVAGSIIVKSESVSFLPS